MLKDIPEIKTQIKNNANNINTCTQTKNGKSDTYMDLP